MSQQKYGKHILALDGLDMVIIATVAMCVAFGWTACRVYYGLGADLNALKAPEKEVVKTPAPYAPTGCLWLDDKAGP